VNQQNSIINGGNALTLHMEAVLCAAKFAAEFKVIFAYGVIE